jgi:hypothetical protein
MAATFYVVGIMICLFVAAVSILCSFLTLFSIYKMNRFNVFMKLVGNLAVSQMIYDIGFFFFLGPILASKIFVGNMFAVGFGVASSLWTNLISLEILYVVIKLQPFNRVTTHFRSIQATIYLLSSCVALCLWIPGFSSYSYDVLYFWFRLSSIVFNVGVWCLSYYILSTPEMKSSAVYGVLCVLIDKIKYYPIVQVVTRAGAAWYEYNYGTYGVDFSNCEEPGPVEAISAMMCFVLTPSAGIGYFMVYLRAQPLAYRYLKSAVLGTPLQDRLISIGDTTSNRSSGMDSSVTSQSQSQRSSMTFNIILSPISSSPGASLFLKEPINQGNSPLGSSSIAAFSNDDEDELIQRLNEIHYLDHRIKYSESSHNVESNVGM